MVINKSDSQRRVLLWNVGIRIKQTEKIISLGSIEINDGKGDTEIRRYNGITNDNFRKLSQEFQIQTQGFLTPVGKNIP